MSAPAPMPAGAKEASPSASEFVAFQNAADQDPVGGGQKKAQAEPPRKIKYTSDVKMIVEDFAKAHEELKAALKESHAIVAHSEINSSPNTIRNGFWRIRVPVEQFDKFREALVKLGDEEKNTVDSEDMTSQYYDLEAHVKNRQAEREAIRKLLEKVGEHDIKQVLEVKRELNAITDDINRKEGQLRLWANLTDLTTINLTLREKQKYVTAPTPTIAETPTFGMRADKTWSDSWESFLGFCQAIALFVIAMTPWLPVILMIGLGVWLVGRRVARPWQTPVASAASSPPTA
jgi:hypothetical protein